MNEGVDPRIDVILELLMQLAGGNLDARIEHSGAGDALDAIIESVNMLAEELCASTVSKEFLTNVLHSMVDMLVVCSADRSIYLVNNAACEVLGYSSYELVGQEIDVIFADNQDEAELAIESWMDELALQGVVQDREMMFSRKDDTPIPVMMKFLTTRDTRGGLEAIIITARDLRERKQAEQEKVWLTEQLQSQKLEAIGNLAGGVAHDMNNMLTGVMGLASALQAEMRQEDPMQADIAAILTACQRGRDLTRNLLGFARKGKYRKERLSLNHCVKEVQGLLTRTISKKITMQTQLEAHLADIEGDPTQMNQLLVNLALNAADAMYGQGTLTIVTENYYLGSSSAAVGQGLKPGRYVRLAVSDTGEGMDPLTLQRAFEPFFTTKATGKGTGLGLSMVHGSVKNHGGEVVMDSVKGKGTTVTIYLPALEARPDETPALPQRSLRYQGAGTILLVDDEELVRTNSKRLLEGLGHTVILAEDGQAAVEQYRAHHDEIKLVILDLIMPVLDGEESFKQLKEINPQVRVLLSSGYSKDAMTDRLFSRGAVGFLQKPYSLVELITELSKATKKA